VIGSTRYDFLWCDAEVEQVYGWIALRHNLCRWLSTLARKLRRRLGRHRRCLAPGAGSCRHAGKHFVSFQHYEPGIGTLNIVFPSVGARWWVPGETQHRLATRHFSYYTQTSGRCCAAHHSLTV
jgi:hypothetical protein